VLNIDSRIPVAQPEEYAYCIPPGEPYIYEMDTYIFRLDVFTDGLYEQETRVQTYRELIREWLWELTGSSLKYICANRLNMNRVQYHFSLSLYSTFRAVAPES